MDFEFIKTLILLVLTPGGIISYFILEAYRYLNKRYTFLSQANRMLRLYDELEKLRSELNIGRVSLFMFKNSGKLIKPDTELNVICLAQEVGNDVKRTQFNYVDFNVDKHYIKMLIDLLSERLITLITDEMPDCVLKDIYLSEGIIQSKIVYVTQKGIFNNMFTTKVFYLSLADKHTFSFGPKERLIIQKRVRNIEKILKYKNDDAD